MSKFSIFLFRNEHFKMFNESLENSLKDVRIFLENRLEKGLIKEGIRSSKTMIWLFNILIV